MSKYFYSIIIAVSTILTANAQIINDAQKARLCNEYFNNGEFKKAAECFKDLHEKDKVQDYYYDRYLISLTELEQFTDADKMIRKAIKAAPDKVERYVDLGNILEKLNKGADAKEQYEKAIKQLAPNQVQVSALATAFSDAKKFDYALQTYEKGEKIIKEKYLLSRQGRCCENDRTVPECLGIYA